LNHSIASAFDLHFQIQKPAIKSFVAAKGLSVLITINQQRAFHAKASSFSYLAR